MLSGHIADCHDGRCGHAGSNSLDSTLSGAFDGGLDMHRLWLGLSMQHIRLDKQIFLAFLSFGDIWYDYFPADALLHGEAHWFSVDTHLSSSGS
jgi:hypothetical protein